MSATTLEQPTYELSPIVEDELFVIQSVMQRLGTPKGLYRVDAKTVWDGNFRVNVYCAEYGDQPVRRVRMTDSFLVSRTGEGITSRPEIVRRYN